jgi:hypothetical protein
MCVQETKTANRFEISSLLEKILLKQVRWCLTFVGLYIYIIMWSGRVICLSDLGNILAYYLDKTTLISLLYRVSNCQGNMPKYYPGNMPKYYSTKYHYRNLHEV